MKPFNFEEFKAGKPAKIDDVTYTFRFQDNELDFPIVCTCNRGKNNTWVESFTLALFDAATMLPIKREVWFPIVKNKLGNVFPSQAGFNSKDEALNYKSIWQVVDAIPYTIEE